MAAAFVDATEICAPQSFCVGARRLWTTARWWNDVIKAEVDDHLTVDVLSVHHRAVHKSGARAFAHEGRTLDGFLKRRGTRALEDRRAVVERCPQRFEDGGLVRGPLVDRRGRHIGPEHSHQTNVGAGDVKYLLAEVALGVSRFE